jgi:acyl carrier protein
MEDALLGFINQYLVMDEEVEVGKTDELLLDGIIDSLGVTRLVGFIEEFLNMRVAPEAVVVENFRTVATLAGYLSSRPGEPD